MKNRFVGTVTDKSFIKSIPENLDLLEKRKILHDVKYQDIYEGYLVLGTMNDIQKRRVYLDEHKE